MRKSILYMCYSLSFLKIPAKPMRPDPKKSIVAGSVTVVAGVITAIKPTPAIAIMIMLNIFFFIAVFLVQW